MYSDMIPTLSHYDAGWIHIGLIAAFLIINMLIVWKHLIHLLRLMIIKIYRLIKMHICKYLNSVQNKEGENGFKENTANFFKKILNINGEQSETTR